MTLSARAVVLVHDRDPELGRRDIGTLASLLQDRGFHLDVHSFEYAPEQQPPSLADASVVVVMGSPDAAYDDSVPWLAPQISYLEAAIRTEVPILGVCFGGQLLARVLGGSVRKSDRPEYGFVTVETDNSELVGPGPWMEFHEDTFTAPPEATVVARTEDTQQAFVLGPHLGLQFHPEISVDAYHSWAQAWTRDDVDHGDLDVDAIARSIALTESDAKDRCAVLLDAFLDHARTATGLDLPQV